MNIESQPPVANWADLYIEGHLVHNRGFQTTHHTNFSDCVLFLELANVGSVATFTSLGKECIGQLYIIF